MNKREKKIKQNKNRHIRTLEFLVQQLDIYKKAIFHCELFFFHKIVVPHAFTHAQTIDVLSSRSPHPPHNHTKYFDFKSIIGQWKSVDSCLKWNEMKLDFAFILVLFSFEQEREWERYNCKSENCKNVPKEKAPVLIDYFQNK